MKTNKTQQQYLQISLAEMLVKAGHPEAIFAPDSPVKNLRFRSAVLKRALPIPTCCASKPANNKPMKNAPWRYTLLTQSLVHRDYAAYLKDSK
ncbi:MAG: hypothetical protein ACR5LF_13060 [Symbiopectobacterium sp.]